MGIALVELALLGRRLKQARIWWLLDRGWFGGGLRLVFGRGRWLRLDGCGVVGGRLLSGAGAGRGWAGFRRFWLFDADWFRNLGGVCRGIALKSFRYDNKHGQGIDKVGGGAFPPPTL